MLNKNKINKINKKAMSLIEVMIAVFIFTLWISSVFIIISSTSWINTYNKNFIIASNLAKEQIELIRNIRDTNYKKFQKWNILRPETTNYAQVFKNWDFYKIENGVWIGWFHISSSTWSTIADFELALKTLWNIWEENYKLCLNSDKNYIYCTWWTWEEKTPFYKYIEIKEVEDKLVWWTLIKNAFKIKSWVYWNYKWIHKTNISTIITDWKRL